MTQRAFTDLTIKAFSSAKREFEGIATTPRKDRAGDVIDPKGAKFKNPVPLLAAHDHRAPIGHVVFGKPTENGITFKAKVSSSDTPGAVKERLDSAWDEIEAGLVRAVSVGIIVKDDGVLYQQGGGRVFTDYEIVELSAVTIPMNADAVITAIRSLDQSAETELPADPTDPPSAQTTVSADGDADNPPGAATGNPSRVVRLSDKGRDGPPPFVIRRIHRAGSKE